MWRLRCNALLATACTGKALVHFLFFLVDSSRSDEKTDFCLAALQRLSLHALGKINEAGGGDLHLGEVPLAFSASGSCDMSRLDIHGRTLSSLQVCWEKMHRLGSWSSASLMDVTHFAALCRKTKRTHNVGARVFPRRCLDFLDDLQTGVASFLADCLDHHVRQILQNSPDALTRKIPSRRKSRDSDVSDQNVRAADEPPRKNRKVETDVDTIWELMEEAQQASVSLPVLATTKKSENSGGCSPSTVIYCIRKYLAMYRARAHLSFDGVKYINVITDSSTFSTRDTCVSAAFSFEKNAGCYLAAQAVKGNHISPGELLLEDHVEQLIATRKADRIAAYRLLQAISHQLGTLTNGKLSLQTFQVSAGNSNDDFNDHGLRLALTPLTPDHVRIVGDFGQVYVKDKRTLVHLKMFLLNILY